MKRCSIKVDFDYSENICGKFTLRVDKKTILKKVPVVIPLSFLQREQASFLSFAERVDKKFDSSVDATDNRFGIVYTSITQMLGHTEEKRTEPFTYIESKSRDKNDKPCFILSSGELGADGMLLKTQDFFSISPEHFAVIKEHTKELSSIRVSVEKAFILFFAATPSKDNQELHLYNEITQLDLISQKEVKSKKDLKMAEAYTRTTQFEVSASSDKDKPMPKKLDIDLDFTDGAKKTISESKGLTGSAEIAQSANHKSLKP